MPDLAQGARRHGIFVAVLVVLAALYLWLDASDDLGGLGGDGLIYVATARYYAPYWPADPTATEYAAITQFPPLYALSLMAAGGAASLLSAHVLTVACLLGAFAAFYAWLCALGIARARAALGVALFAIMPGTWLQSFYLHPEGLYVALVFATLASLAHAERTQGSKWWWTASATAAAAIMTRTAGVTLLPALAIALWRGRPRGALGMLGLAVAPQAVWGALHRPPWGYSDSLAARFADPSPSAILASIFDQLPRTLAGFGGNVVQSERLAWLVAALGGLGLAVAAWRFVRLRPDAWYLFAYLGVLALWPFPGEAWRLTWVVVPIVLGYFLWAAERALEKIRASSDRARGALLYAPTLIAAALLAPGFALLCLRAVHPLALQQPAYRHMPEWYDVSLPRAQWLVESRLATVAGFRTFAQWIPPGECVFSPKPLMTAFFTGRVAFATPAVQQDAAAFDAEVRRKGCRFFILHRDVRREYPQPHYPLDRLRPRLEIVASRRIDVGPESERAVTELALLREAPGS